LIQRPDKDWQLSVFSESHRSERAALALLVLPLSLAMNKAVDFEHFETVLETCWNQIESPIKTFMAAVFSSMFDIIKAAIKFSTLLNALSGPMPAALAANTVRAPAAVVALCMIAFKIALPVLNLIEICEILPGAFEAIDDWKGEALFLLVRII
jgi:hypothetical protein